MPTRGQTRAFLTMFTFQMLLGFGVTMWRIPQLGLDNAADGISATYGLMGAFVFPAAGLSLIAVVIWTWVNNTYFPDSR